MTKQRCSPWFWVPSLYYAEGIPYILVMMVSVILYKRMGVSNTEIALYTSWLYLPWVIKPLWSPVVDGLRTRRFWIISSQLAIAVGLSGIAFSISLPESVKWTLVFFWLLAFSSATQDIAIDGFYMLGLSKHDQAWFVGFRATFYRLAMITGQGLLIILAGYLESATGHVPANVTVQAVTEERIEESYKLALVTGSDLRVLCEPEILKIPIVPISQSQLAAAIKEVTNWNKLQGQPIEKAAFQDDKTENKPSAASSSWWNRFVVDPLEVFIRTRFREKKQEVVQKTSAGNARVVQLQLSHKPRAGEEIVVNFGRRAGDKSISLLEGSRFVFTEANWDKPVQALIQLDHRLKTPTEAVFQASSGNIPVAWSVTFATVCVLFAVFFIYHKLVLPFPDSDRPSVNENKKSILSEYLHIFAAYFKKDRIWLILAFLLLYRFAEAQLVKMASPFLLDTQETGGLGLTTGQVGFVYGTVGIIMLSLGGLIGGLAASRHGLKYWLLWMALAINLPDLVYVYLAYFLPDSFFIVNLCVAIEQFGYGFGFTAYMLYMIYASEGQHKTAYFAISTGFMALGMMIPGMFSGWLQDLIGYKHFFIWVVIATIPGFIILPFLPLDPGFGKKVKEEK